MKKVIFTITIMFCFGLVTQANNIQISNVSVSGTNVTFDIAWENSWNSMNNVDTNYPRNWDAAWVFVKVQSNADNLWKHQNVSTTSAAHSVTGGILQADAVSDGIGVFIRRTNSGSGNISGTATLSMQTLPAGLLNFKVFGVEMVNIPQGQFYVNDGGTGLNRFNNYTVTSASIGSSVLFSSQPALPATYPTGYQAMYSAKYETSNAQLVDFLNTLTYDQQQNLTGTAPNGVRGTSGISTGLAQSNYYVEIDSSGVSNTKPAVYACNTNNNAIMNEPIDGQNNAAVGFSARMAIAYLDWSGLRPMTDMEYEKICRGTKYTGIPNPRVLNAFAWGTTNIAYYTTGCSYFYTDSMKANGAVVNGRCYANGSSPNHLSGRCGMFAEGSTGREGSGASFYGTMEMTGNAYEFTFFTNTSSNGITTNSLGDGFLANTPGPTNGNGNVAGWSDYSANTYWGVKGGTAYGFVNTLIQRYVSSRSVQLATAVLSNPSYSVGVRGVR